MGGVALPLVVDERETLALGILELEDEPTVALCDLADGDALLGQVVTPPVEGVAPVHSQVRPRDAASAALLAGHVPIEERQVVPRAADGVGVEEVIGADVVLIHAALDEAHPHHLGVEAVVRADVSGDGGEVMNAGEVHGRRGRWAGGAR